MIFFDSSTESESFKTQSIDKLFLALKLRSVPAVKEITFNIKN